MRKTRVLLADDHPFLRGGLRLVLDRQSDLIVVAEAADGRQAVDEAARVRPDIAVLDIAMPNLNGVEAAFQIHANLLQHLLHEIF